VKLLNWFGGCMYKYRSTLLATNL